MPPPPPQRLHDHVSERFDATIKKVYETGRATMSQHALSRFEVKLMDTMAQHGQIVIENDMQRLEYILTLTEAGHRAMDKVRLEQRVRKGDGPRALQLED